MTLKELLKYGKDTLQQNNIDDYDLISKVLVEYVCGIEKNRIIIFQDETVEDAKVSEFESLINKVAQGTPVQYITNKQEFMKLNFYVDENVLIPQPDTEILVEEVIKECSGAECKVLDLCTGSGAIGISIAKYIQDAHVVCSDISVKAIQVAKLNAEKDLENLTREIPNMSRSNIAQQRRELNRFGCEIDKLEMKAKKEGLTELEASKRLTENGKNELPKAKQDSILNQYKWRFDL